MRDAKPLAHAPAAAAKCWTWAARGLAIAFALFLGVFAFDAFEGPASFGGRLLAFALHLTPTWLCLGGAALAWRRQWLGGPIFGALAIAYACQASDHPSWILLVSGPLAVIAALHVLAWRSRRAALPRRRCLPSACTLASGAPPSNQAPR